MLPAEPPGLIYYNIVQWQRHESDGRRCLFLVQSLTPDGELLDNREITVERDAMGMYELLIDGGEYYDVEAEAPDLTQRLMDLTAEALHVEQTVDASVAINSMRPGDNGQVH
jgi:hypothetical protein